MTEHSGQTGKPSSFSSSDVSQDLRLRIAGLLSQITPGEWQAVDWPGQGWTIVWKPDAPIAHMRWTDGLRPEVEKRIEAEAKFIAAAPSLLRSCLLQLQQDQEEIERLKTEIQKVCPSGEGWKGDNRPPELA